MVAERAGAGTEVRVHKLYRDYKERQLKHLGSQSDTGQGLEWRICEGIQCRTSEPSFFKLVQHCLLIRSSRRPRHTLN